MSFNSVVTTFTTLLNRTDCTDAQAIIFVMQGINRIQRELRLPCMERMQLITSTGTLLQFPVPPDLLQLQDIMIPDLCGGLRALKKLSYRELMKVDVNANTFAYARFQNLYYVRGTLPAGTTIQVLYHGEFTPIPDPTQDNEITESEPDMIVYAALGYAGDFFECPNTDRWLSAYTGLRDSIKQMAEDLEMNGGPAAVQSMYSDSCQGEY